MKKGTRYKVYYNGEDQQVGFMQGLDSFDCDIDTERALLSNFNLYLPIPNIYRESREKGAFLAAFFTEEGLRFFSNDISTLKKYWEENLHCEIVTEYFEHNEEIIYEDEYQFIVKRFY